MRHLVEQAIIDGFNAGFDEVRPYLDRLVPGERLVETDKGWISYSTPVITDINLFVSSLTDEELLEALDKLHCQMYR